MRFCSHQTNTFSCNNPTNACFFATRFALWFCVSLFEAVKMFRKLNKANCITSQSTFLNTSIFNAHATSVVHLSMQIKKLSLQWNRKIECGNSCRRMLTLFEPFGAAFYFIWFVNPVPTPLFSTTPLLITTHFAFIQLRIVTSVHGQRPAMQHIETFLMSQCNI